MSLIDIGSFALEIWQWKTLPGPAGRAITVLFKMKNKQNETMQKIVTSLLNGLANKMLRLFIHCCHCSSSHFSVYLPQRTSLKENWNSCMLVLHALYDYDWYSSVICSSRACCSLPFVHYTLHLIFNASLQLEQNALIRQADQKIKNTIVNTSLRCK